MIMYVLEHLLCMYSSSRIDEIGTPMEIFDAPQLQCLLWSQEAHKITIKKCFVCKIIQMKSYPTHGAGPWKFTMDVYSIKIVSVFGLIY